MKKISDNPFYGFVILGNTIIVTAIEFFIGIIVFLFFSTILGIIIICIGLYTVLIYLIPQDKRGTHLQHIYHGWLDPQPDKTWCRCAQSDNNHDFAEETIVLFRLGWWYLAGDWSHHRLQGAEYSCHNRRVCHRPRYIDHSINYRWYAEHLYRHNPERLKQAKVIKR